MVYSTAADVQKTVYGATNSDQDNLCTEALEFATAYINSKLNILTDISSPSTAINECAKLLAAGIITSSGQNMDSNDYWKKGIELLELLIGDNSNDGPWGITVKVDRF